MVEPVLALFEMQVKGLNCDAIELLHPSFTETPEALDAVDMCRVADKLTGSMIDSVMFTVADINQSVIAAPTITVDDRPRRDATANNGLQSSLFAVRYDLGIDAAIAFEDAEDDGLPTGSAPALATHTSRPEIRLVNFDFTSREGRSAFALLGNTLSDFEKDHVDAFARQGSECGCLAGRQIMRKEAHNLTEFTFTNFGTPVVAV